MLYPVDTLCIEVSCVTGWMSRAESPGPAGYRSTTRATVPPETPDGGRPRTFERPMHRALAPLTVALIAATTCTGVWVTMHWGTDPYTQNDALATYRAGASGTATDPAASRPPATEADSSSKAPAAGPDAPTSTAPAAPSTSQQTPPASSTAVEPVQPSSTSSTAAEGETAHRIGPPRSGVYEYESSGFARVNGTALRHDYPDRTYGIAQGGGGCRWSLDHRPVEQVVDVLRFCSDPESVGLLEWRLSRTFLGVTMSFDLSCQPAPSLTTRSGNEAVTEELSCATSDGKTTVDGTLTISPRHDRAVGDDTASVHDVQARLQFRGDFNGSAEFDFSVEADTGLKISERRLINATGAANYHEEATFALRSLNPTT